MDGANYLKLRVEDGINATEDVGGIELPRAFVDAGLEILGEAPAEVVIEVLNVSKAEAGGGCFLGGEGNVEGSDGLVFVELDVVGLIVENHINEDFLASEATGIAQVFQGFAGGFVKTGTIDIFTHGLFCFTPCRCRCRR